MRVKNSLLTVLAIGLVFSFCFSFTGNAMAADWYTCEVVQVVPWSDGDTRVQLAPGTGETRFSGTARVNVSGSDAGANRMIAVILTAISLPSEITVLCEGAPSWTPVKDITGVGLVAP